MSSASKDMQMLVIITTKMSNFLSAVVEFGSK